MKTTRQLLGLAALVTLPSLGFAASQLTITAVNQLPLTRASQTLELSAKQLEPLGEKDFTKLHVRDAAGKEVLCQAVDTNDDALHKADILIFQADFAPGETKTFTVSAGTKQQFDKEQFKAFGRFVRERFDDFAWENDRIAHRTYGQALETWAGEPLTSSTIDIWSKRTPRMVINDWYLADHYHKDTGEGADFYSAGKSRGCGGNGLWAKDQLWTSKNFVNSRVLANGPIRVLFELDYDAFPAGDFSVKEVKRITLDAGSQLDHFQSRYTVITNPAGLQGPLTLTGGIGLKKVVGDSKSFDATNGTLVIWEKMEKDAGMQGVAVVVDPKSMAREAEDKLNHLVLAHCGADHSISYWAGFAWDKAGEITDEAAWKKYVGEFARGLQSPIEVSVAGK
jgi:hypothetical protein